MNYILFLPFLLSILIALIFIKPWIRKAHQLGLVWENMNRYGHPKNLAGSGGIVVIVAFVFAVLAYIAVKTFILKTDVTTVEIFALLMTVGIASMIGFIDDLFGWVHGGLSAGLRIVLVFFAAIPLMVINAGHSKIMIPFLGTTELGWIYPVILIPLGIIGASTTFNFLAGFNGLEAGQGIIVLAFLSFISYLTGSSWLALISLYLIASLMVFYFYNKYPAKVLPGDVLTYAVGSMIACMAILGNFERIAIFVFIPYILEVILKVRGKLKKHSFGIAQPDGSLELPYNKFYGLTHVAIYLLKKMKGKAYEKDVVYLILAFQIVICLLSLLIFKTWLFV